MFEGKGNILAKILTEKWVGHGPPVPPCSYTYEHNGDIRHKQMYIQSLSIWRGLAHVSFRLAGASARGLGGFGQDLRSIWQSNSRLGRRSARACAEADFRETSGTT